jgi:hypothetical protein
MKRLLVPNRLKTIRTFNETVTKAMGMARMRKEGPMKEWQIGFEEEVG